MHICKLCQEKFGDISAFHLHLKIHDISQKLYYTYYVPKYDKLTNEPIPFKNAEQYLSTNFLNNANMNRWFYQAKPDEIKSFMIEWLIGRKQRKRIKYTPCQVELRSLNIPGINFLNQNIDSYYNLCSSLGYLNRYITNKFICGFNEYRPTDKIIIDTREQKPLKVNMPFKTGTICAGDYTVEDRSFCHDCYIERKSISDLYGTLSKGFERFENEINRLQGDDYLVVLVEETITECLCYNKHGYGKVNPEYIFKNIRDLTQKYSNVQFLFVAGRRDAVAAMHSIFKCKGQFRNLDLQLVYDAGNLI